MVNNKAINFNENLKYSEKYYPGVIMFNNEAKISIKKEIEYTLK